MMMMLFCVDDGVALSGYVVNSVAPCISFVDGLFFSSTVVKYVYVYLTLWIPFFTRVYLLVLDVSGKCRPGIYK